MPKIIAGKPVDEAKWKEAKKRAAEEGHAEDYAYIVSIYKRMAHIEKALDISKLIKTPVYVQANGKVYQSYRYKKPGAAGVSAPKAKLNQKNSIYRDALGNPEYRATISVFGSKYGKPGTGFFAFTTTSNAPGKHWPYKSKDVSAIVDEMNRKGWDCEVEKDGYGAPVINCEHRATRLVANSLQAKHDEKWKNAKDVYVRFGDIPKSGYSTDWSSGHKEKGVSVFRGKILPNGETLPIPGTNQELGTLLTMGKRPLYVIEGEEVGLGSDGEPVLANAKQYKPKEAVSHYYHDNSEKPLKVQSNTMQKGSAEEMRTRNSKMFGRTAMQRLFIRGSNTDVALLEKAQNPKLIPKMVTVHGQDSTFQRRAWVRPDEAVVMRDKKPAQEAESKNAKTEYPSLPDSLKGVEPKLVTLEIASRGRKYFKAHWKGKTYNFDVVINKESEGFEPGKTYTFPAIKQTEESRFGTKTTYWPTKVEGAQLADLQEKNEKEHEQNKAALQERIINQNKKELEKWLGWVEEKAAEGYVYQNGVDKLVSLGIKDWPDLDKRLQEAISQAKRVALKKDTRKYLGYIEENLGQYWYQKGMIHVLENIGKLKEMGVDTEKYEKELDSLRDRFKEKKEEKERDGYKGKIYHIGGGQGYGYREYEPHTIVRNPAIVRNPDEEGPRYLYVLSASKHYFPQDGMSFGVGDEQGYYYEAVTREATEEESAELRKEDEERQRYRESKQRISNIANKIRKEGEAPVGEYSPEGKVVLDTSDPYGGGEWFVIGKDYIWYVQNNGMDGDNWGWNNVRTSGAGAIGWRVPYDKDLADELIKIDQFVTPYRKENYLKSIHDPKTNMPHGNLKLVILLKSESGTSILAEAMTGRKKVEAAMRMYPDEMAIGEQVETEHTKNREIARKIAADHLMENRHYYTKLIGAGLVDETSAKDAARKSTIAIQKGLPPVFKDAERDNAHRSAPKGYPKSKKEYADPNNYKYPLDTEEHVRAAISYFSQPKNYSLYSPEERRAMWARIRRAAKKYGIAISDKNKFGKATLVMPIFRKALNTSRLIKKPVNVNRGGKIIQQHRWVRPDNGESGAPMQRQVKTEDNNNGDAGSNMVGYGKANVRVGDVLSYHADGKTLIGTVSKGGFYDGVIVKDSTGKEHPVEWKDIAGTSQENHNAHPNGKDTQQGEDPEEVRGSRYGYGMHRINTGDTVAFRSGNVRLKGTVIDESQKDGVVVETSGGEHYKVKWRDITGFEGAKQERVQRQEQGNALAEPVDAATFEAADWAKQYDEPKVTADEILDEMEKSMPEVRDEIAKTEERLKNLEQTIERYRIEGEGASSVYSEARQVKHKRILDDILSPEHIAAALPKEGEKPVFVMLGGRGGSGKSWFDGKVYNRNSAIVLDADEIKGKLDEYEGWNAAQVHEESSDILEKALVRAREMGLNVVLDATMKSAGKALAKVDSFKQKGYSIEAHYMYCPRQEAAKRAVQRFMGKVRRYVPVEVVLGNTTNEQSFDQVRQQADVWSFRNSYIKDSDGNPSLVAAHGQGRFVTIMKAIFAGSRNAYLRKSLGDASMDDKNMDDKDMERFDEYDNGPVTPPDQYSDDLKEMIGKDKAIVEQLRKNKVAPASKG